MKVNYIEFQLGIVFTWQNYKKYENNSGDKIWNLIRTHELSVRTS
jgi:hypothetical protein